MRRRGEEYDIDSVRLAACPISADQADVSADARSFSEMYVQTAR
jgi:hypothetical protein